MSTKVETEETEETEEIDEIDPEDEKIGNALEHAGFSNDQIDEYFLEHYGKKGMQWGVRNAPKRDLKSDKAQMKAVSQSAREIISQSRRAETKPERAAAAARYKTEVVDVIKTPAFKAAYNNANKMGKGEMVAHVVLLGPLALLTIPATKNVRDQGYNMERDVAGQILQEMRRP